MTRRSGTSAPCAWQYRNIDLCLCSSRIYGPTAASANEPTCPTPDVKYVFANLSQANVAASRCTNRGSTPHRAVSGSRHSGRQRLPADDPHPAQAGSQRCRRVRPRNMLPPSAARCTARGDHRCAVNLLTVSSATARAHHRRRGRVGGRRRKVHGRPSARTAGTTAAIVEDRASRSRHATTRIPIWTRHRYTNRSAPPRVSALPGPPLTHFDAPARRDALPILTKPHEQGAVITARAARPTDTKPKWSAVSTRALTSHLPHPTRGQRVRGRWPQGRTVMDVTPADTSC